jgi:hypothetical protein
MLKLYTVKQLQYKGGLSDNSHWVTIWSGSATSEKEAKKKARMEITVIAEETNS